MKNKKAISLIVLVITIIVMIILASAVIITLANNGIIGSAKRAVDKMDKAQITQLAELIKGEYLADAATDKDIEKSVQELRERIITAFEVTKDTNNDNIIEVNSKWAVVIKNTDLDIEVVEITNALKASSIVGLTYTRRDIVEDDIVYVTDIDLNITRLIDLATYNSFKEGASSADKEKIVIEYLSEDIYLEPFESIDDAVVYDIVSNGYGEFTTIDECLTNADVQQDYGTTKEQLYYAFCTYEYSTGNSYTKEQLIDFWYDEYVSSNNVTEYNTYTRNLKLYVKIGKTETLVQSGITLTDEPTVITQRLIKNETYEYILKTSSGKEIVSEKIKINNIATEGPYILTENEVDTSWNITETGKITSYNGTEEHIIIPIRVGDMIITEIGTAAFEGATIKSVSIPNSIETIGINAFKSSAIEYVEVPESVDELYRSTFEYCRQLKSATVYCSSISSEMFDGCKSLEKIIISETVKKIGAFAFFNCTNLKEVVFEGNILLSLGNEAFKNCTSLKSIVIPEGVTSLGGNEFNNCTSLEEITLPNSITYYFTLGNAPFSGCTNLTKIYFAPGDNPIPDGAPYGAPNPDVEVIKLK